jgi:DNA processing protein
MFTQHSTKDGEQIEELSAWLRLALSPGVGNEAARRLLAAFGLPQNIFSQSLLALGQVVSERQALALRSLPEGLEQQVQSTLAWLTMREAAATDAAADSPKAAERGILTLGDALYPPCLLQISDPPVMLYLQGAGLEAKLIHYLQSAPAHDPLRPRAMAMVGSRNPSSYGLENAKRFASSLVEADWLVVSGLALGIDAAAHEGALVGGSTWAVVGTGLDRVYPSRNHALARRIAAQGLMLSEYPLGTPPLAHHFPQRNRIIAGLCQGVLVVEAAVESGSLITARAALEQGREVFAIPGSIHSPQSKGCHSLLRQGAKLVESAKDILEELGGVNSLSDHAARGAAIDPAHAQAAGSSPRGLRFAAAPHAPDDESTDPVLRAMGHEPVGFDALQARCGLDTPTLQAKLLELELMGEVRQLPGALLGRVYRA